MNGTVETLDSGVWQLRFARHLRHPVEEVWAAITEPARLAAWFPTTITGDRKVGASLEFVFPGGEAPPFAGEVLAWEPPHTFAFRWGTDTIRLEVESDGEDTILTLLDALDAHGKAARDAAGWHTCLDALEAALAGDPNSRKAMGRWTDVHQRYVDEFGPEASTIGPPGAA